MENKAINRLLLRTGYWLLPLLWAACAAFAQAPESFGRCDGCVWIATADGEGRALLDPADGRAAPIVPHYTGSEESPSALRAAGYNPADNHIYAFTEDGDLQLLRIAGDGSAVPLPEIAQQLTGVSPSVGAFDQQGFYYVGERSAARIYRIDPAAGRIRVIPLSETVIATGLAWHGGRLYRLGGDGRLFAIEVAAFLQGEEDTAVVKPLSKVEEAPSLQGLFSGTNGVFAQGAGGNVYQYDLRSGQPRFFARWKDSPAGSAIHNPATAVKADGQGGESWPDRYLPGTPPSPGLDNRLAIPTADITISLRSLSDTYTPGGEHGFELLVENEGGLPVDGVRVRLPLPEGVDAMRWTCTGDNGSCSQSSGTGPIDLILNIEGQVVITVIQTIDDDADDPITTRAVLALPEGVADPDPGDNIDSVTLLSSLGESFGSCDGRLFLHQNENTTDLVLVDASTSPFSFSFAGNSTGVEYNAAGYNPADNFVYAISSDNALIRIGSDGTSEVVQINILPAADWAAGDFADDGFFYVATSGALQNVFRIDVTLNNPVEALFFDTTQVVSAGDMAFHNGLMYTVDTSNNQLRSFDVVGAPNGAVLPVTNIGGGFSGGAITAMWGGPSGLLGANGEGAYYQFDPDSGEATLLSFGNASSLMDGSLCSDAPFQVTTDLAVTKDDFQTSYTPGQTVTYNVTVSNNGPADVEDAVVSDPLPVGITGASWTCTGNNGGTCGAASGSGALSDMPDIPVFGSVTYSYTLTIPRDFPGELSNTATVTPPEGVTDSAPGNNSATDTDQRQPLLTIEKVSFGGVGTFSFSVSNAGGSPNITTVEEGVPVQAPPQAIVNAGQQVTISEPTPAPGFTLTDISCTGLSDGGSVTVDLNARMVTIDGAGTQPGADIVCTFTNEIEQTTVTIEKVSFGGVGTFGFSGSNVNGSPAITTVEEGVPVQAPPLTVFNPGQQVTIGEPTLPEGFALTDISCTGLFPGGSASVDLNARTVTIDGTGTQLEADIVCTFTNEIEALTADLAISKTDNSDLYTPGTEVTYDIVVTNNGPDDVQGATVTDNLPAGITSASWTCSASGGAACGAASGSGSISETVDIPVGGSVTYSFTVSVPTDFTGDLSNTATVNPPDGVTDPDTSNNTATDINSPNATDLAVSKMAQPDPVVSGNTVTYTITVDNLGPLDATNAVLTDTPDANQDCVTPASITCSASGGAQCPTAPIDINDLLGAGVVIPSLPANSEMVFTVECEVTATGL